MSGRGAEKYRDRVFERAAGGGVIRDQADFVVIGTGPSGATVARVLTAAGHDVIMIEEGRWIRTEEFTGQSFVAQKLAYRELGSIAAMGKNVIPIIQGRCVGGGSVINAAIIWRMPQDVYDRWDRERGIGRAVAWSELESAFETLETELSVRETPAEVLGKNNALLKAGADRLGFESRIIPRNERGCQGWGRCLIGCPIEAKQSTDLTYVPAALERGARLYAACRADQIDLERGRVKAVRGRFEDPLTGARRGELIASAKKGVIVCASPIQTPALLWRSGIGLSSGHLGYHFMGHPGAGIMGVHKDEIRIWEGATQGWDSEHYRQSDRVKFEALSMPPDLMAARLPGVGAEFKRNMHDYERLMNVGCAIVAEAEGTVRPIGKSVLVRYSLTPGDVRALKKGLKILAELLFTSGCEQVLPSIHGLPSRIGKDQLRLLDDAPENPQAYTMVVTHLFGTARIGSDPRDSVVGHDFQVHDARGVYVLDSSFFPSNLGVNPQHTIMAFAMAASKKLAAQ